MTELHLLTLVKADGTPADFPSIPTFSPELHAVHLFQLCAGHLSLNFLQTLKLSVFRAKLID